MYTLSLLHQNFYLFNDKEKSKDVYVVNKHLFCTYCVIDYNVLLAGYEEKKVPMSTVANKNKILDQRGLSLAEKTVLDVYVIV